MSHIKLYLSLYIKKLEYIFCMLKYKKTNIFFMFLYIIFLYKKKYFTQNN